VIEQSVAGTGERSNLLALLDIFSKLAFPGLGVADLIGRNSMAGSSFVQEVLSQQLRTSVLKVLRSRFGDEAATDLTPALATVDDPRRLERLFDQALAVASPDEFRAALGVRPLLG